MPRGSSSLLFVVVLFGLGCRASEDDCREVAQHVMELAQGTTGATSPDGIERTCNEQRPTRALLECMLTAQSLPELESC
jgi:hypothetical protein